MDNRRKPIKALKNLCKWLSEYWATFLVTGSIFLVLIVTLFPFTFNTVDRPSLVMLSGRFFGRKSSTDDLIANVLLFLPLGFGLAVILQNRFSIKRVILAIILIFSSTLSLTVETLQILLPMRSPSVLDLLANSIGGLLGAVVFYIWQIYSPRFSIWRSLERRWLTKRKLTFTALCYAALMLYLMIALKRTNNFSNWDPTFPLLIGNERTGDRPWNGMISQVYIANRSLSLAEITQVFTEEQSRDSTAPWTTAYQLTGNGNYPDRSGLSPDLEWQGYPPKDENKGMISLTQQHWLLTQAPATKLIQAIQKSSQFSLLTTIATSDNQQTGPARIISFSADPFRRNLTIGQQGSRLIVRLRTPLSGVGGSNPELAFPGIFADTNSHRLLLNFDQSTLQLFVDGIEQIYTLTLSPEILFFRFLPAIGIRNFQVTPMNQWILKGTFYSLAFLPPTTLMLLMIKKLYSRKNSSI